jgi:hypothetical protein
MWHCCFVSRHACFMCVCQVQLCSRSGKRVVTAPAVLNARTAGHHSTFQEAAVLYPSLETKHQHLQYGVPTT